LSPFFPFFHFFFSRGSGGIALPPSLSSVPDDPLSKSFLSLSVPRSPSLRLPLFLLRPPRTPRHYPTVLNIFLPWRPSEFFPSFFYTTGPSLTTPSPLPYHSGGQTFPPLPFAQWFETSILPPPPRPPPHLNPPRPPLFRRPSFATPHPPPLHDFSNPDPFPTLNPRRGIGGPSSSKVFHISLFSSQVTPRSLTSPRKFGNFSFFFFSLCLCEFWVELTFFLPLFPVSPILRPRIRITFPFPFAHYARFFDFHFFFLFERVLFFSLQTFPPHPVDVSPLFLGFGLLFVCISALGLNFFCLDLR